ncbi:uncharacterized protein LOC124135625 isoform X2 [Haliotis rufescens]|uniref:uncharacterized protein LOC124135625 isoform X1 n=1 Tax=Haliotis rufescens TaxID=6454 RepID=UPI00201F4A34|nr:uncharacterized protein LOC124135625 isoform X1 [Haliotis rufescens]XP_046356999.2 uncharacterized protein LOC124135625 isoform X2 [Haliotis rufescens]
MFRKYVLPHIFPTLSALCAVLILCCPCSDAHGRNRPSRNPCPATPSCQQNGVVTCQGCGLPTSFACLYGSNGCDPKNGCRPECMNGGTKQADGTCVCKPGYMGNICQHDIRTCHDIYSVAPDSASGEYTFWTKNGSTIRVWCRFRSSDIITYFSKSAVATLTTEKLNLHFNTKSKVSFVAKWTDMTQSESTISQLDRFSFLPLGIMANEYTLYTSPHNLNLGPYLFLGFHPQVLLSNGFVHGYNANGVDKSFRNCDGNPNAYFTFYTNPNQRSPSRTGWVNPRHPMTDHWNSGAQMLSTPDHLNDDYFYDTELHFGGCGTYAISTSNPSLDGIALGVVYVHS